MHQTLFNCAHAGTPAQHSRLTQYAQLNKNSKKTMEHATLHTLVLLLP